MALHRLTTPYGPPAFRALRDAVDRVQAGDPLAPVTVLVHSNAVGVAARRWLAANGGVAAAQFVTAFRLAELLGGQALAERGKRPISTPVVDVAVRQVLNASSGIFLPIAQHQATITALRNTYRDLRHVPAAQRHRLATHGSGRAREIVRLCEAVHQALHQQWYDEADLLRAAGAAAHLAPGRTVVFLPQRMRPTEQALLDALAEHGEVVLLEGQHQLPAGVPLDVVDASDADEEVREAVRSVAAAMHAGTALHRIGIVWPRNEPYARLVGEHLEAAGIPWNGRPGVALHERLAPRLVLDLFRLDRRGIRRADLFALLAHVPARLPDGALVPRQRWERISRDAGLAGDADWNERLSAFSERARARGGERQVADADSALQLQAFVADLRVQLGTPDAQLSWQHWADLGHRFLHRWLGGHRGVAQLPPDEFDAYATLQASLDRLGRLDALAEPVTRTVFAHTLEAELDSAPGRVGHIGVGVHVGPLSFAVCPRHHRRKPYWATATVRSPKARCRSMPSSRSNSSASCGRRSPARSGRCCSRRGATFGPLPCGSPHAGSPTSHRSCRPAPVRCPRSPPAWSTQRFRQPSRSIASGRSPMPCARANPSPPTTSPRRSNHYGSGRR